MSNTLFGTWIVRSFGHKLILILSESIDLCIFNAMREIPIVFLWRILMVINLVPSVTMQLLLNISKLVGFILRAIVQ